MATPSRVIRARWQQRGRLAADWVTLNEVLLDRERGIETDTKREKLGDGVTPWNSLAYLPTGSGGGATNLGYTPSTRVLTSDTGTDVTLPLADGTDPGLMASADFTKLAGIAAGAEVNVNADWNAGSGDAQILNKPNLSLKADLVGGVIPTAQIPALAVTEFLGTVANQSALLALTGQRGDWAIRTDTGTTWVLVVDGGSLLAHWQQLSYPAAPVSSVNSQTGAVVLGAADVGAATAAQGTDSREWTASTVTQAEAEARIATTRRAWTAERVGQAIAAWWLTASSAFGRTLANVADAAAGRTALGAAGSGPITSSGLTMATARILGRGGAGTGAVEEITLGTNLSLSGTTLNAAGGTVPPAAQILTHSLMR